jgi:hypothetical protein
MKYKVRPAVASNLARLSQHRGDIKKNSFFLFDMEHIGATALGRRMTTPLPCCMGPIVLFRLHFQRIPSQTHWSSGKNAGRSSVLVLFLI